LNTKQITYNFNFEDGSSEIYELEMDVDHQRILNNIPEKLPAWTELEYKKCGNCPLNNSEYPHCPLSANLVNVIDKFSNILSYDKVELTVTIESKEIKQKTDAQTAVSSLMGLLIATSGCPHTEFLKPMAHFHFPLATEEETLFRSTGAFLLSQYFKLQKGVIDKMDLNKLAVFYKEINIVNQDVSERIKAASKSDSAINAIVLLDIFALIFPEAIEDSLKEIEYIFKA